MDDLDRYGDYNEIDYAPTSKNPIALFIKILIAVIIVSVVGIIGFRIALFNYYPQEMKTVYFNDTLTEYYNAEGGNIDVKTQGLRAPYDDAEQGNFFCDNLFVIFGADQLQLSLRYNVSVSENIVAKYGIKDFDVESDFLTFRLVDNYGRVYSDLSYEADASLMMYRYKKLVFDGVELLDSTDGTNPEWIRLEIFITDPRGGEIISTKDSQGNPEPFAMVPVYENNEDYNIFNDYELSDKEAP